MDAERGSEEGPATSEYNIKTGLVRMAAGSHRGSAWRLLYEAFTDPSVDLQVG